MATLDELIVEMRRVRQSQEVGNDEARKQAEMERKLLGQSEKQYEAMLQQRSVTEASKKAMDDIEAVLGEDAKNNKQFQDAQKRYNKEQAKAQKLESRRNLLSRFKDTKGEKGTGAAIGELGGTALKGIGSSFKKLNDLVGGFGKIFKLLVIPALVLLVNSPAWPWLKSFVSDIIHLFSEKGPIGSSLKPILDFFGAGGALGGIMTGLALLATGLTAAVVFKPFKVMGGIANLGKFLGKKLFNIVSGIGGRGAASGGSGAPSRGPTGAVRPDGSVRGRDPAPSRDRQPARGQPARGGRARGGGGIVGVAQKVSKLGKAAGAGIGGFLSGILKGIASGLAAMANPLSLVGLLAVSAGLIAIATAARIMKPAFEPIGKLVESVGKSIKSVFAGISETVTSIGGSIRNIIEGIGESIGKVIDKISNMSTAGTKATTDQIKELSAIPGDKIIGAAKGIEAMKKALDDFGGGTLSKIGDSLFGSDGPITKIVELTSKVPELMKAAEAINVLGAAGSDFAAADAELSRRKRITTLTKDIASGDVEGSDTEENIKAAKDELAELRRQSKESGLAARSPAQMTRNAEAVTASGVPNHSHAAAPVVVAPSSTVNEGSRTSNNVSTSASLKPTGTTGALVNGAGSMAMQGG